MTWIKTIGPQDDPKVAEAMEASRQLYPIEYATPVAELVEKEGQAAAIVSSHSLIPDALNHAFSTFGALMSPDLPLKRRQHEMIAATVSALNDCFY
ncbi:MAG: hypothetical protein SFY67_00195 [Candidatus Melainabacteria bacterium]|nr:hypothetical protein [Candidatus Melainabacteria bacterium]